MAKMHLMSNPIRNLADCLQQGCVALPAQDALGEISRQRQRDLAKPLRVHFICEDGIDAGGVKKEFFQLLVTELLCPDYGMLIYQPVCGRHVDPLQLSAITN